MGFLVSIVGLVCWCLCFGGSVFVICSGVLGLLFDDALVILVGAIRFLLFVLIGSDSCGFFCI